MGRAIRRSGRGPPRAGGSVGVRRDIRAHAIHDAVMLASARSAGQAPPRSRAIDALEPLAARVRDATFARVPRRGPLPNRFVSRGRYTLPEMVRVHGVHRRQDARLIAEIPQSAARSGESPCHPLTIPTDDFSLAQAARR